MSDNPLAYFDETRNAVILRLESGSEIAVMDTSEAESLADEIAAAARGEETGYTEFLAQERGEEPDESDDDVQVLGQSVAYPNGRCSACGYGLSVVGSCVNTDCSAYDRAADPHPPVCVLTEADGEDADDCATHDHEDDGPIGHPEADRG